MRKTKAVETEPQVAWGIRDVEQHTGLSRVTIWKLCKRNAFPLPRYVLGNRKWWKADVQKWVADQDQAAKGGES